MNKHEFHGYILQTHPKATFYTPIHSDQTVIIIRENEIVATIQYVNNGLTIKADSVRIEGNVISISA